MSNIPSDLRYTRSHEWVRDNGDGTATVGISDHAQELLGDLVFVETPEIGANLDAGDACAVVESVKAASDVYTPLAGEIIETNANLADEPELVNNDAFGEGWQIMAMSVDGRKERTVIGSIGPSNDWGLARPDIY